MGFGCEDKRADIQGSSEVSIMFGIEEKDLDKAIIALYNEFFEKD